VTFEILKTIAVIIVYRK